jgi:ubiquinone/menaquinone biosynthesis C-methylase UbiE
VRHGERAVRVGWMGACGHADDYFVESIQRFPEPESFAQMMRDAGLEGVSHQGMTFGVVNIHSGFKL